MLSPRSATRSCGVLEHNREQAVAGRALEAGWTLLRQKCSGMPRSLNSFAFGLITCCRKRIPIETGKTIIKEIILSNCPKDRLVAILEIKSQNSLEDLNFNYQTQKFPL